MHCFLLQARLLPPPHAYRQPYLLPLFLYSMFYGWRADKERLEIQQRAPQRPQGAAPPRPSPEEDWAARWAEVTRLANEKKK